MAQRPKTSLYPEFDDGERPSGADFRDLIDSYINLIDDPVSIDPDSNFVFDNAVTIGDTTGDALGTIRFTGTQFEFREASGWTPLGSGGGAFQLIGGGPDAAFNGGNVGINTGGTATGFMFEVALQPNDGAGNQVRFGSAVIHDSETSAKRAYFSHVDHANNTEFALMQLSNGRVHLNVPSSESIRFTLDGNITAMSVNPTAGGTIGYVTVGAAAPSVDPTTLPSVRLFVEGDAWKLSGPNTWQTSDVRLKQNITPFHDGLSVLKQINPINFRYNGKAFTQAGDDIVGVSGQEMEKVAPYMIRKVRVNPELDPDDTTEYLVFNSQPLLYLAINAVKELSERIENLEKQIVQ